MRLNAGAPLMLAVLLAAAGGVCNSSHGRGPLPAEAAWILLKNSRMLFWFSISLFLFSFGVGEFPFHENNLRFLLDMIVTYEKLMRSVFYARNQAQWLSCQKVKARIHVLLENLSSKHIDYGF
jgi:hypothetical protein